MQYGSYRKGAILVTSMFVIALNIDDMYIVYPWAPLGQNSDGGKLRVSNCKLKYKPYARFKYSHPTTY